MSKILSEARQLCEDLEPYPEEIGEDGSKAVLDLNRERWEEKHSGRAWAAFDLLPELLAYAEIREAQAIAYKADLLAKSNGLDIHIASYDHVEEFYEQAAKELDADLSPWRRITEEEKEAIQEAIISLKSCDSDERETIEVLRHLL